MVVLGVVVSGMVVWCVVCSGWVYGSGVCSVLYVVVVCGDGRHGGVLYRGVGYIGAV